LILARFDRLDQAERRLLQVASIIGQNFSLPLLQKVLQPSDTAPFHAALALLVEREFIVPQAEAAEREYAFRHALVSDAIYGTLLRRDRTELHGQVGEAMETLYAGQLDGQVELLASHYQHSPRLNRALHYLLLAGQKSARGYANAQAQQYYEQALALLPQVAHELSQTLQAHTGLGDVMLLTGDYPAARAYYETALEAISAEETPVYSSERSALQRKAGMTFEAQGSYDEALLCLEAAQGTLEKTPGHLPVERARIFNDIGWILFRRGNLEEAERYLRQALALVKDLPYYDIIASIYNRLGGVAYKQDDLDQASRDVGKSLALRQEIGDIVGVARLHNNLGLLDYTRGEWDSALEHYKQNLELQTRLGDAEALAFSHLNLAVLQIDRGDLDEAQANLERSLEASRQIGAQFHIAAAQTHFGRLWLIRQEWERGLQHLEESFRIFTDIGAQENLVDVYHLVGEVNFGLGNLPGAANWAQRSIDLIMQMGSRVLGKSEEHGRALRLLGRVALAEGDWAAAGQQ
ncbi:MAG: ATP-binding protein, partial [Anaerolineales bacterium]